VGTEIVWRGGRGDEEMGRKRWDGYRGLETRESHDCRFGCMVLQVVGINNFDESMLKVWHTYCSELKLLPLTIQQPGDIRIEFASQEPF
jgi:hypothetical protein